MHLSCRMHHSTKWCQRAPVPTTVRPPRPPSSLPPPPPSLHHPRLHLATFPGAPLPRAPRSWQKPGKRFRALGPQPPEQPRLPGQHHWYESGFSASGPGGLHALGPADCGTMSWAPLPPALAGQPPPRLGAKPPAPPGQSAHTPTRTSAGHSPDHRPDHSPGREPKAPTAIGQSVEGTEGSFSRPARWRDRRLS